ncbi:hypothetical protein [Kaarinaea lacus]
MNSKTAKLISPERVVELLDCYGADPEAWPDDERVTALALIQHSTQLQNLQKEAKQLDQFLSTGAMQSRTDEPVDMQLVSRITANLPAQEKTSDKLLRHGRKPSLLDFSSWTGMVAATIAVFVITVSIMELHPSSTSEQQYNESQAELDYWMWQQVTGEVDNEEEEPLNMMALFEPDE